MRLIHRADPESDVLELLDAAGCNVERVTMALRDLVAAWPDRKDLVDEIVAREHEGDRLAHDVIHLLAVLPDAGAPFDARDGHQLVSAVDDVVDFVEQTADSLGLYRIDAAMEQGDALAEVLAAAGAQVALALACLRAGRDPAEHLIEIHRLENEGDRLSRGAIATLFVEGIDPMVVIRWKDIYESLESAIDSCETVAHVIEGILIKRRR